MTVCTAGKARLTFNNGIANLTAAGVVKRGETPFAVSLSRRNFGLSSFIPGSFQEETRLPSVRNGVRPPAWVGRGAPHILNIFNNASRPLRFINNGRSNNNDNNNNNNNGVLTYQQHGRSPIGPRQVNRHLRKHSVNATDHVIYIATKATHTLVAAVTQRSAVHIKEKGRHRIEGNVEWNVGWDGIRWDGMGSSSPTPCLGTPNSCNHSSYALAPDPSTPSLHHGAHRWLQYFTWGPQQGISAERFPTLPSWAQDSSLCFHKLIAGNQHLLCAEGFEGFFFNTRQMATFWSLTCFKNWISSSDPVLALCLAAQAPWKAHFSHAVCKIHAVHFKTLRIKLSCPFSSPPKHPAII
ncbi:putative ATP-dependent RNA helicase ddx20, partial [Ophiophagus hannah]